MIINGKEQELKLEYPCTWNYKVFTQKFEEIENIVSSVVNERTFTLEYSHTSKNGTYKSYDVELLVHNDDDRHAIFPYLNNTAILKWYCKEKHYEIC